MAHNSRIIYRIIKTLWPRTQADIIRRFSVICKELKNQESICQSRGMECRGHQNIDPVQSQNLYISSSIAPLQFPQFHLQSAPHNSTFPQAQHFPMTAQFTTYPMAPPPPLPLPSQSIYLQNPAAYPIQRSFDTRTNHITGASQK